MNDKPLFARTDRRGFLKWSAFLGGSAFAAGPALLILLCLFIRRFTNFDPGKAQIQTLAKTVAYAICINVFLFLCEVFVGFYSNIPGHMDHIKYLFFGLHGHGSLVPFMWTAYSLMLIAIILLVNPITRKNEGVLAVACLVTFIGTWIDKGMGMISGRKAFQRPMADGVKLLNGIQDVFLDKSVTIA